MLANQARKDTAPANLHRRNLQNRNQKANSVGANGVGSGSRSCGSSSVVLLPTYGRVCATQEGIRFWVPWPKRGYLG